MATGSFSGYDLKFKMPSKVFLVGGLLFFNTLHFIRLRLPYFFLKEKLITVIKQPLKDLPVFSKDIYL